MKRLPKDAIVLVESLRAQITMVASALHRERLVYLGFQDFVLRHGRVFTLDREKRPDRPASDFPATTPKECFTNAMLAAAQNPDLTYVEGYADNGFLPIHHAWVIDDDGNVYDPTWENLNDGRQREDTYLGVPFETDYLVETVMEKDSDTLLDRTGRGVSLEREPDEGAIREIDAGIPVPKSRQGPDTKALAILRKAKKLTEATA